MYTTKIFRFEHHDNYAPNTDKKIGEGCYKDTSILSSMYERHRMGNTHPSLVQDIQHDEMYWICKEEDVYSYFCACPTLPKLKKWFKGFLRELKKYGYIIAEYEVDNCIMGISEKQCFFHPKSIINRKVLA
jgi:hypothetical protein